MPPPQVDPSDGFVYYEFFDQTETLVAQVIATSAVSGVLEQWGFATRTEYWKINVPHLSTSDPAYQALVVKKQTRLLAARPPFEVSDASFQLSLPTIWTPSAKDVDALQKSTASSADCGFAIELQSTTQGWLGTITFYRTDKRAAFQSLEESRPASFVLGRYHCTEVSEIRLTGQYQAATLDRRG